MDTARRHDRRRRTAPAHAASGFTLIEILIVTTVLGVIVTSIAVAFSIFVRVAPNTEVRIDDARSTRGLATWLAHDTTSTPRFEPEQAQGGFDLSPSRNDCGGLGGNILHLTWVEDGLVERTFVANYRFVPDGGSSTVVRYTCRRNGTSGPFGSVRTINLTSGLDTSQPPVVTLQRDGGGNVDSVSFELFAVSGEHVLVETGPRNPTEFF